MTAPNSVQRAAHRTDRYMMSDDLLAPCATEGGTFREAPPPRPAPLPTRRDVWADRVTNAGIAAILLTTLWAASDHVFGMPWERTHFDHDSVLIMLASGLAMYLCVRVSRRKGRR